MIEAFLISVIMFGIFAMGWLAHPFPPDPHPPDPDCCIGIPDIPDTPEELLRLSERKL